MPLAQAKSMTGAGQALHLTTYELFWPTAPSVCLSMTKCFWILPCQTFNLLHLWGEREASSKSARAEGRSETLDLALHHKSFTSLSPHQNTSLRSHPTSLHSHGDRVSNCLGGRAPAVGLFSSSAQASQAFSTMVD